MYKKAQSLDHGWVRLYLVAGFSASKDNNNLAKQN